MGPLVIQAWNDICSSVHDIEASGQIGYISDYYFYVLENKFELNLAQPLDYFVKLTFC